MRDKAPSEYSVPQSPFRLTLLVPGLICASDFDNPSGKETNWRDFLVYRFPEQVKD